MRMDCLALSLAEDKEDWHCQGHVSFFCGGRGMDCRRFKDYGQVGLIVGHGKLETFDA